MERQDEDIGQSKKRKVSEKRSREGTTRLREENEGLKQELDRLKGEVEQVNERWMRAAAEFENFKKRSDQEPQPSSHRSVKLNMMIRLSPSATGK